MMDNCEEESGVPLLLKVFFKIKKHDQRWVHIFNGSYFSV